MKKFSLAVGLSALCALGSVSTAHAQSSYYGDYPGYYGYQRPGAWVLVRAEIKGKYSNQGTSTYGQPIGELDAPWMRQINPPYFVENNTSAYLRDGGSGGGKMVASMEGKITVHLEWQGSGTPTKTCYVRIFPNAIARADAPETTGPSWTLSADSGIGKDESKQSYQANPRSGDFVQGGAFSPLPASKVVKIDTGSATVVDKEIDVTLKSTSTLTISQNGSGAEARVSLAAGAELSDYRFTLSARPNSPYSTTKDEPDDKEIDALAKLSWKDDGVVENPLVPFYMGAGDFSVSAQKNSQDVTLNKFEWTASPHPSYPF